MIMQASQYRLQAKKKTPKKKIRAFSSCHNYVNIRRKKNRVLIIYKYKKTRSPSRHMIISNAIQKVKTMIQI
jgi:hypothetical protein